MLECQKRAIKKYVEKNREKVNEYNRDRYSKLREENGERYERILTSKKEYYHKRKAANLAKENEIELENTEPIELTEIKENQ